MPAPKSLLQRLADKFTVGEGCWEWTGAKNPSGYGQLGPTHTGAPYHLAAHRVMYELFVGPISTGLEIDHLCGNRGCVRPSHLEPVRHQENLRRAANRITHCPQGHEITERNIGINNRGHRYCAQCNRDRARAHRNRMVALANL